MAKRTFWNLEMQKFSFILPDVPKPSFLSSTTKISSQSPVMLKSVYMLELTGLMQGNSEYMILMLEAPSNYLYLWMLALT